MLDQMYLKVRDKQRIEVDIVRYASALTLWSVLVLVEGAIRAAVHAYPGPDGELFNTVGFPEIALLIGGVCEVVFGAAGILLGVFILLFDFRNTMVTFGFMIFQSVLGWFVFATFVLAVPIYNASNLLEPSIGTLDVNKFLIMTGMFVSIAWCAAIQAGQFIFASMLKNLINEVEDSLRTTKIRGAVWSGFATLGGLFMIFGGAFVLSNVTTVNPQLPPPAFPPLVNIYPEGVIACGCVTFVWGILGIVGSLLLMDIVLKIFHYTWFLTFLMNVVFLALIFGRVPAGALAHAVAQHMVLIFSFTTLPIFFTSKLSRMANEDHEGHEDMEDDVGKLEETRV